MQLWDITKGYASFADIYYEIKLDVSDQCQMLNPGNFIYEFLSGFAIHS